jgi:hypothetical protein
MDTFGCQRRYEPYQGLPADSVGLGGAAVCHAGPGTTGAGSETEAGAGPGAEARMSVPKPLSAADSVPSCA